MKQFSILFFAITLLALSSQAQQSFLSTPAHGLIVKDSANKMINSYLNSLQDDSTDLHSLVLDGNVLREYLADTSIVKLKLMFAHTLPYINSGNANRYAGYKIDALTIVIAGFDAAGNYIYAAGNAVPNHCVPCPHICPLGKAGSSLLE